MSDSTAVVYFMTMEEWGTAEGSSLYASVFEQNFITDYCKMLTYTHHILCVLK
jgi:hypothetical protein